MKSFYGESTGSVDCSYKYKRMTFSLGVWNPFKNMFRVLVSSMLEMVYIKLSILE